jgi:hypothetical protein
VEKMDYGEAVCVAKAICDDLSYDVCPSRIEFFEAKIRESILFDKPDLIIPYAQHSSLN